MKRLALALNLRSPSVRLSALVVFVSLLGLVSAQAAFATHVRPKGATPLRDSLVIAQQPCTAPTTSHSPPLAFPSCTTPVQTSQFVTAGTIDANGSPSNLVGSMRLDNTGADININSSITDVRCMPGTAAAVCSVPNGADGPDYTGELQLQLGLRITDHFNTPPGFTDPGTTVDTVFPVTITCVSTASVLVGSTCAVSTSMNTLIAGSATPAKRTVYEIPQRTPNMGTQVYDGGPNGVAGSAGATLFLEPGVFLP